jgi:hypothetical protein
MGSGVKSPFPAGDLKLKPTIHQLDGADSFLEGQVDELGCRLREYWRG